MADTPPKRKRGRPPKAKAINADVEPDALTKAAEDAAAAATSDPPAGDAPPGGPTAPGEPKRRRSKVTKKGTQQIEDGLREILQMPAVPASIFGDQWAAQHFTQQGAVFANKIAVVSERNPVLRDWCNKMLAGESLAVLLMASVMYAGPAALHFGVLPGGELLGVPVLRKRSKGPQPVPAEATVPTDPAFGRDAPEAQPYGGAPSYANGEGPPVWEPVP